MSFGEKMKKARIEAGLTQEELAEVMTVSRAAIAKWESDRGMPDISNLKTIAEVLNVSVDYLLNEEGTIDLTYTKKPIDLTGYGDQGRLGRLKKIEIKEKIVREEYPDAEIVRLTVTKIDNNKGEKVADALIGWFALLLGGIPLFGTQEMGKTLGSLDQSFYLVNKGEKQYFVLLTDEHIIARAMMCKIQDKKFRVGEREFVTVGLVDWSCTACRITY